MGWAIFLAVVLGMSIAAGLWPGVRMVLQAVFAFLFTALIVGMFMGPKALGAFSAASGVVLFILLLAHRSTVTKRRRRMGI